MPPKKGLDRFDISATIITTKTVQTIFAIKSSVCLTLPVKPQLNQAVISKLAGCRFIPWLCSALLYGNTAISPD